MSNSPKINFNKNQEQRQVEPFKLTDYQKFLSKTVEDIKLKKDMDDSNIVSSCPPGLSDPLAAVFRPIQQSGSLQNIKYLYGDNNKMSNERIVNERMNERVNENYLSNYDELLDRGRVAVFIDGSNLFFTTTHHLQFDIDFTKLVPRLIGSNKLVRASYYTGNDPFNEKQQKFFHMLRCTGYKVITKDLQTLSDGNRKVNLDVEIAVDMINMARSGKVDTIICISGNGDLTYALQNVVTFGVRVEVVSYRQATHENLIHLADKYVDLSILKEDISKQRYVNQRQASPRWTNDNEYNN